MLNTETLAELNKLLAYLREFEVVDLVREKFARHGNDAPPKLLASSIERLAVILGSLTQTSGWDDSPYTKRPAHIDPAEVQELFRQASVSPSDTQRDD